MLIYLPVPSAQCSRWRAACSPPSAGGARTQARRSWCVENGQTAVNTAVKCTLNFYSGFFQRSMIYTVSFFQYCRQNCRFDCSQNCRAISAHLAVAPVPSTQSPSSSIECTVSRGEVRRLAEADCWCWRRDSSWKIKIILYSISHSVFLTKDGWGIIMYCTRGVLKRYAPDLSPGF